MIVTRGLTKRYGRIQALKGLDMEVPEGAVYGFIGQNGAGKTTTLRILAGLLRADGGQATIGGYDIQRHPRVIHDLVGYMPDFFGVYDDLRVGEYLEFYAAAYGIRGATARTLRDGLLELVDLAAKRDAFVDTLSRGMQQRLCLARALIHDPPVLLLDEPASGLDPLARVEMRELLKELCLMGKTIIISSHILSELADLCTHIGMVADGRILRQGPLEAVLAAARSRRYTMRCLGTADAAVTLLAAFPEVTVGEPRPVNGSGDEQVELVLPGGATQAVAVLRHLIANGVAVTHFAETWTNLETTFIELAREETA
ncbi:MAG: type transport system ATP-binding protein [Clostridia bacterium]|nr:type transport system ATP-binding protein [Clostridia bacterium]